MSEAKLNLDEICARFSQIHWHDSKLTNLHILKRPEKRRYDLQLDLDLIVNFSEHKTERNKYSAIFRDCRIIRADLDLLGVLICGGDIGAAVCYLDAHKLESERRNKIQQFDLPDGDNPLERCLGFVVQMIPPGGEIIIFARDFQLASAILTPSKHIPKP
jgi:hypothetical protein